MLANNALVATMVGIVLAFPAVASSADWPQFHFGADRSGYNPNESTLDASNLSRLGASWRTAISNAPVTSPVVVDGVVFVGSNDRNLYALDASTGAILWSAPTGEGISRSPAVANGRVYVGSDDSRVYAFPTSCSTPCAPLWATPTNGRISSAPAVANGVVYVGAGRGAEGDLWALDAATGAVKWTAPLSSSPNGVAVSGNVVYAAFGSLYAFPTECSTPCSPLWIGWGASALPVVGDGRVFSDGSFVNNAFNAFPDTDSCSSPCPVLWTGLTGSGTSRGAAVAGGRVYVPDGNGTLAAYPTACTGFCSPSWSVPLGGFVSDPAVANGVVYVGTGDGIRMYDSAAGAELSAIGTGGSTLSPAVVNGAVYASTFDFSTGGTVSAFVLDPVDTTPPTLHLPDDLSVVAFELTGAPAEYTVTATDNVDPSPSVSCSPPSGSTFPIGTSNVDCVATDSSGNSVAGSFAVTVIAPWDLSLNLATRGSVVPGTGVVTVSGTVSCNRTGTPVSLFGQVRQEVARRATLTGSFFAQFACIAPSSTWQTTVIADNGRFGAGKVDVQFNAFGCELTCDSVQGNRTITLTASKS
jgi:outer membrane protein assembly factor BamB